MEAGAWVEGGIKIYEIFLDVEKNIPEKDSSGEEEKEKFSF